MVVAVVQLLSRVQLFTTPWTAAHQAPLFFTISQSLLRFMSIELWCYLTISLSVALFSFCLLSFPASGSFPMSQVFSSGSQSTVASASTSVLPVNTQDWFPLGLTGFISWLSKGLSRVFSSTTVWKHQLFGTQPSLRSNSQRPYMTTGKTIALTVWTLVGKVMSLLFNMLSRFFIAFLSRSKHLLIS